MGDWFAAAQQQHDNALPPYLDNEDLCDCGRPLAEDDQCLECD